MKHKNCGDLVEQRFAGEVFMTPPCLRCAIIVFMSEAELARWMVVLTKIRYDQDRHTRLTDEFMFWVFWLEDLQEGVFLTEVHD